MSVLLQTLPMLAVWMWARPITSLSVGTRIATAFGIGLGLSSAFYFVWRLAGGSVTTFAIADPLLWTSALVAGFVVARPTTVGDPRLSHGVDRWLPVLALVALVVVGAAAVKVWWGLEAAPFGEWDAWAIWNLRARFLFDSSALWRSVFTPALDWTHPDYPLLLPASVARAWVLDGNTSMWVPVMLAAAFTAATAVLMAASLYERRGVSGALLGLSLLLVPAFIMSGVSQQADVPLGFFTLLAVVLLAARQPSAHALALSGAAMGMAAWTKNEGLVVAVLLPTIFVGLVYWRKGFAAAHGTATEIMVGLWPMLIVVALFKILLAPDNDLMSGMQRPGTLAYWSDGARMSFVAGYMLTTGAWWGRWLVLSPMLAIPIVAFVPTGLPRSRSIGITTAGVLVLAQCAVFFAIFVMTPYDVVWHSQTWGRLVSQIWPTIVWWACARHAYDVEPGTLAAHGEPSPRMDPPRSTSATPMRPSA